MGNMNSQLPRENGDRERRVSWDCWESRGYICSQPHTQTCTSVLWEHWQPLLSPVYILPVDLPLVPCISESQPHEIAFCSSGRSVRYLIWPGESYNSKSFSVMIVAELLKTAMCRYEKRDTSEFQQAVYFLKSVKSQTASLDGQRESSLQKSNKYCDAIDSESDLGGRSKETFSGARYRLPNNNDFRLKVIVQDRETEPEHCCPAGQEGKGL